MLLGIKVYDVFFNSVTILRARQIYGLLVGKRKQRFLTGYENLQESLNLSKSLFTYSHFISIKNVPCMFHPPIVSPYLVRIVKY